MTDRRALLAGSAAVFVVSFFAFAFFFLRLAVLVDSDSYYHLAVARLYGEQGIFAIQPWGRFSLLANGGDKEFLFHLMLVPFATLFDPAVGGRIALALLNAALVTTLAWYAARAAGPAGLAFPLWLWIAAPPFFARVVRLRPELLALLIILLAIGAVARRRYVALGVLACAFALGYTAFHVFVALALLWFAVDWWMTRRADVRLVVATLAGTMAGLVVRPHALANIRLWYVQNVEFFRFASQLDVGNEIRPPSLHALMTSIVFAITIAALVALARRAQDAPRDAGAPFALAAAIVFLILFARFGRMSTYAFPLVAVAAILWCGARARRALPWLFAASALLALPSALDPNMLRLLNDDVATEADLERFGRAVPRGAKIAANWGDGELYAFWAPQGRYLNVLEPLFMARPYRRAYDAQARLFAGLEPDVAGVARRELDSDFIAFDATAASPRFVALVRRDSRLRVRYGGSNVLLEIVPPREQVH